MVSKKKNLTRKIAEKFLGNPESVELASFTEIEEESIEVLLKCPYCLNLVGLTELTESIASGLAKYDKGGLRLGGLHSISSKVAKMLAKHKYSLVLEGLNSISIQVAEALGKSEASLNLNGLTELSDESAKALSSNKGGLSLDGLTSISIEAAEALGASDAFLSLDGLTLLSRGIAISLAKNKGGLSLNGIKSLSSDVADALARLEGNQLIMQNVVITSETVILSLGSREWDYLEIGGFSDESFSDECIEALARNSSFQGGLTRLTVNAALYLAMLEERVSFWVKSLTEEVAEVLARRNGPLEFQQLSEITDGVRC